MISSRDNYLDTRRPLLWLADVVMIATHAERRIDWERLVEQAHKRRLILPVRDTLSYVREYLEVRVPDATLSALSRIPTSRHERIEYHYKRKSWFSRPLGYLPILWFDYLRWTDVPRFPRNLIGFIPYLLRFWGAESRTQALQCLGHMIVRRVQRLCRGEW